jgi:hypothetical protein
MRGGYDFDSVRFFVSLLTQLINITVNQILTQEWFLLQDIKDSSYFRNSVFCSTLSEFEKFLLYGRILINVTTCQNETSS